MVVNDPASLNFFAAWGIAQVSLCLIIGLVGSCTTGGISLSACDNGKQSYGLSMGHCETSNDDAIGSVRRVV